MPTIAADVDAIHARIAGLGRSLGIDTREATQALYAPLHPEALPQRVLRDLAYGTHPRQVLDLHLPSRGTEAPLPVLVFVHGGGFVGGDKGGPGRALHDNVGRFAVEHGLIGATMNYRFAPEFTHPSGAEDVAAAVVFLSRVVGEHGGDGSRIVAMGHSAGAAHVATCVATPTLREDATGLVAAVLSSGIFDPAALWGEVSTAYYGADPAHWPAMASRSGLAACPLPLMFVVAEHDPPDFHRQAAIVLADYVEAQRHLPRLALGLGHNHFSSPAHYGTIDDELSEQVAHFLADVTN